MGLCCENCFSDQFLKKYIKEKEEIGDCDFCNSKNVYCIPPTELAGLFGPVVSLYSPVEDFMPMEDLKQWDGEFIWDKLQEDWDIFELDYDNQRDLMHEMFPYDPSEGVPLFLDSPVESEDEYWGTEDEPSDKLAEMWKAFCDELIYENRFFPKKDIDRDRIVDILSFLSLQLKPGSLFFRARKSDTNKKFGPSKMGKPPAEKTKDGRANPKGIPYLYLASDADTAISEIRPTIKEHITVGKFILAKAIYVIDLRDPKIDSPFRYSDDLDYVIKYLTFMRKLGWELSKAVHPKSAEIEYIPLQYLCELIKSQGYDGVIYKSSMGNGYNLTVFDGSELKCTSTTLHEIEKIDLNIKKIK